MLGFLEYIIVRKHIQAQVNINKYLKNLHIGVEHPNNGWIVFFILQSKSPFHTLLFYRDKLEGVKYIIGK